MLRIPLPGMLAVALLTTVGCGPGGTDEENPPTHATAVPSAYAAPLTARPTGLPLLTWYPDEDGDQHGAAEGLALTADHQPDGYADSHDDCDDADSLVYPGAVERGGNGKDEDCDGRIDEWDDFTPAP
jgi:hypothetical protein